MHGTMTAGVPLVRKLPIRTTVSNVGELNEFGEKEACFFGT